MAQRGNVHLFTLNLGLDGGFKHQVLENGRKRSDSNSASNQNRHLEVNPLLMALAKWPVQVQLEVKQSIIISVANRAKWRSRRAKSCCALPLDSRPARAGSLLCWAPGACWSRVPRLGCAGWGSLRGALMSGWTGDTHLCPTSGTLCEPTGPNGTRSPVAAWTPDGSHLQVAQSRVKLWFQRRK